MFCLDWAIVHIPSECGFVVAGMKAASDSTRFNWAARKLHKRLLQLGANEIYPRGEANAQHPEGSALNSPGLLYND